MFYSVTNGSSLWLRSRSFTTNMCEWSLRHSISSAATSLFHQSLGWKFRWPPHRPSHFTGTSWWPWLPFLPTRLSWLLEDICQSIRVFTYGCNVTLLRLSTVVKRIRDRPKFMLDAWFWILSIFLSRVFPVRMFEDQGYASTFDIK
jgi:hypothetical protein